jgi:hypothetical protein
MAYNQRVGEPVLNKELSVMEPTERDAEEKSYRAEMPILDLTD